MADPSVARRFARFVKKLAPADLPPAIDPSGDEWP